MFESTCDGSVQIFVEERSEREAGIRGPGREGGGEGEREGDKDNLHG